MPKNPPTKIIYYILAPLAALLLITSATLTLVYLPFTKNVDQLVLDRFNRLEDTNECTFNDKYCLSTKVRYEVVPLKDNVFKPLNPVYTVVFNHDKRTVNGTDYENTNVIIFELRRSSLFDQNWTIVAENEARTKDLSFDQVKEYAQNHNIYKHNANTKKITKVLSLADRNKEDFEKVAAMEAAIAPCEKEVSEFQDYPKEQKIQWIEQKIKEFSNAKYQLESEGNGQNIILLCQTYGAGNSEDLIYTIARINRNIDYFKDILKQVRGGANKVELKATGIL